LLNYVVLRALWKIDVHLISTLVNKSLYYYYYYYHYSILDSLYKRVKQHFEIEFYICNIVSRRVRVALTKLRVSSHVLRIESGRYGRDRIKKAERKCSYCMSNDIEDECINLAFRRRKSANL